MSLQTAMAALAEVGGELAGVARAYGAPPPSVADWPALVALPGTGQAVLADVTGTNVKRTHLVRLWACVAPEGTDMSALGTAAGLIDPLIDRIWLAWANQTPTERDPRLRPFRSLRFIGYDATLMPTVGGTPFFGFEMTWEIQEDSRVNPT